MADLRSLHKTENRNITMIKGKFHMEKFGLVYGDIYNPTNLSWWGMYVKTAENGTLIAEVSKDSEETADRKDWRFYEDADGTVNVYFESDFSYSIAETYTNVTLYYDAVLEYNGGFRVVLASGTFTFNPLYTREDDTNSQLLDLDSSLTTDVCNILSDQRTDILASATYTTTLAAALAIGGTNSTIAGGSAVKWVVGGPVTVVQDDGTYHEATVTYINGTDLRFTPGVTDECAIGNSIFYGHSTSDLCD